MTPEQIAAVAGELTKAQRDAMEVWENACLSSSLGGQEAAARIIQQYGDQRRAEADAAGFQRGVEAAAIAVRRRLFPKNEKSDWTAFAGNMAQAALTAEAEILALLETKEKG